MKIFPTKSPPLCSKLLIPFNACWESATSTFLLKLKSLVTEILLIWPLLLNCDWQEYNILLFSSNVHEAICLEVSNCLILLCE